MFAFIKNTFANKKQKEVIRARIIKEEIKKITDFATEKCSEENELSLKQADDINSTCKACLSKNLIEVFSKVNGSISGSFTHGLFSGGGHIHGNIDTGLILRCNDCRNEQSITSPILRSPREVINRGLRHALYVLQDFKKYNPDTCKYDPTDENEEFNSLEEKLKSYESKLTYHWAIDTVKEMFEGIHQETLFKLYEDSDAHYLKDMFYQVLDTEVLDKLEVKEIDYQYELSLKH